jgi:hypothetical protein
MRAHTHALPPTLSFLKKKKEGHTKRGPHKRREGRVHQAKEKKKKAMRRGAMIAVGASALVCAWQMMRWPNRAKLKNLREENRKSTKCNDTLTSMTTTDPRVALAERAKARLHIAAKPPSDCIISQSVEPIPIVEFAHAYVCPFPPHLLLLSLSLTHLACTLFRSLQGIPDDKFDLYGKFKAKVALSVLDDLRDAKEGSYVIVTGITPTPLGEGKVSVCLSL